MEKILQDRGDRVQAMPGRQVAGRRGVHTADDGGGTDFQGETVRTGALPGVWEETGKGVTGGAPPKSARHSKRGVGEGGRQGSRGRKSQDLQDGVSCEGRTKALTS